MTERTMFAMSSAQVWAIQVNAFPVYFQHQKFRKPFFSYRFFFKSFISKIFSNYFCDVGLNRKYQLKLFLFQNMLFSKKKQQDCGNQKTPIKSLASLLALKLKFDNVFSSIPKTQ